MLFTYNSDHSSFIFILQCLKKVSYFYLTILKKQFSFKIFHNMNFMLVLTKIHKEHNLRDDHQYTEKTSIVKYITKERPTCHKKNPLELLGLLTKNQPQLFQNLPNMALTTHQCLHKRITRCQRRGQWWGRDRRRCCMRTTRTLRIHRIRRIMRT